MKPAFTKALIIDFPYLFRNARAGVPSSMQYGIAVGDGWFDVLYELCFEIQRRSAELGINPVTDDYPAFDQIKEKFGVLRVYTVRYSDFSDLIEKAVARSRVTCEHCGSPGVMNNKSGTVSDDGWYCVRCDRCAARKEKIWTEQNAAWRALESDGGYRKVIDDAFAEVDSKKVKTNPDSLFADHDWSNDKPTDLNTTDLNTGEFTCRPLTQRDNERCECGFVTKAMCDRMKSIEPDGGFCSRVNDVVELRKKKDGDDEK